MLVDVVVVGLLLVEVVEEVVVGILVVVDCDEEVVEILDVVVVVVVGDVVVVVVVWVGVLVVGCAVPLSILTLYSGVVDTPDTSTPIVGSCSRLFAPKLG